MQSQNDPERTQVHDQIVVHLQRFNRRASRGGQTEDAHAAGAPLKMLRPLLPAWMEEIDQAVGDGVTGSRALALCHLWPLQAPQARHRKSGGIELTQELPEPARLSFFARAGIEPWLCSVKSAGIPLARLSIRPARLR